MEPDTLSAPTRTRTALVLVNERAGSVGPGARETMAERLRANGVERFAMVGVEKLSRATLARGADFDAIVVLGGDGTARAAAELAPRDAPPLVLLPGGTLNLLPKALYGDLPWPEALQAALTQGVVRRLPVGRANGEAFFIAAMFGAPTVLARAREAAREGRFLKALGRVRHFLKRSFSRGIRARHGEGKLRKAEAIGALCPVFSGQLEGDTLEWVSLKAQHFVDLARVSVRALGSGWRDDPVVEIVRCTRGDVASSGIIPATLDGEPRTFFSRVRVTYDPCGPRVLALDRPGA